MVDEIKPNENLSIVDEARKLRDEIKAENDRREALLKEEQKLHAERLLSGTSGSSFQKVEITEEQKKKTGAMDFWKGTGIDKAIEKYG